MSNTYTIEENKNVALVKLNKTWQIPDQVNIIYYYNDNQDIDFLLSIGKGSGFGPKYYSIVQAHEETLVIKISTDPSDVSQLVYDQKALCFWNPDNRYPEPRWYMLKDIPTPDSPTGYTRTFTELIEPAIYRNLDDGFRWFFVAGILKREDDFLTSEQTLELIKKNIGYFKKSTFDIEFDFPEGTEKIENSYYLPEIEYIDQPTFKIKVYDYSGADITDDCTISLGDNVRLEYDPETEKYTIYKRYTSDSSIIIRAENEDLGLTSEIISLWFPEIAYYGPCTTNENDEVVLGTLETKLIYHDLDSVSLIYNLDEESSILLIPQSFGKFKHIFDINGLDYIENYDYIVNFEYLNTRYTAYKKIEPVIISGFKQCFTYLEWPNSTGGGGNSGGGGGDIGGNYYTKQEIDQIIYNIGPDLIRDDLVRTDKTWSSSKLNPIYQWVKTKMDSEIGDKFTIETTSSGGSYYTDTSTQATLTVTVKTKFDGNLVDANYIPSGWSKTTVGTYTKSVTGNAGTTIDAEDFYYTVEGITTKRTSVAKSISSTNPVYYGLINSNDDTQNPIPSQIIGNLTRSTSAINRTETITNSSNETKYLWILTKTSATATQLGLSILNDPKSGKSFTSPVNSNISMTGYKLYVSNKSVEPGGTYTNVNLNIKL